MKRRFKQVLSMAAVTVLTTGCLAGCGNKQEETAAPAAEEETTEAEVSQIRPRQRTRPLQQNLRHRRQDRA